MTSVSPSIVNVYLPEIREPLRIRPRTSDKFVFEQIFLESEYDLDIDLSPRLIIDGGANVGYASIYFANRWPAAEIIAIEPDPANVAVLRRNLMAYPSVRIIHGALWPRCESLTLQAGCESWSSRVGSANGFAEERVRGVTLDEVLSSAAADDIDLLKLDVEGAERDLFDSPGPWLQHTKIIVAELHDRLVPGCSNALERAIAKMEFSRSVLGENVVLTRIT